MALRIPEEDLRGFRIMRNMSSEAFQSFLSAIEQAPGVTPEVPGLSQEDAEHAIGTIRAMHRVRMYHEVSLDKFISDVWDAFRKTDKLGNDVGSQFCERLKQLMELKAFSISAKALSLGNEHEHLYCSARIVTDARPIYGDDVSQPPAALVITHHLKVEYHDAPQPGLIKSIYFGLGSKDIEELRGVLDRAQEKAKSLRESLKASKIRFIDPQLEK